MYRTEDIRFAAYLYSVGVSLAESTRNSHGRTDFVFNLSEAEASKHRVDFANARDIQNFASALEFMQRIVKDAKRNTPRQ